MASLTYGRWCPAIPTTLPEIEGQVADIESAVDFVERLIVAYATSPRDYTILDALCTALVVRYSRLFTSGIRATLTLDELPKLTNGQRELHERVLAIRNKHVAHPVNRFETQSLFVGFDPEAGELVSATVVSSGTRTQIALALPEVQALAAFCVQWREHLVTKQRVEAERMMQFAKELTAAELRNLPEGPDEPELNPLTTRLRSK